MNLFGFSYPLDDRQQLPLTTMASVQQDEEKTAGSVTAQDVPSSSPPVLVFLNSTSGGRMGPRVLEEVRKLIPNSR